MLRALWNGVQDLHGRGCQRFRSDGHTRSLSGAPLHLADLSKKDREAIDMFNIVYMIS